MFKRMFIVFEGIDGSGKTTQAKLLTKKLNAFYTCEPTEGQIGRLIREILKGKKKCEKETLALLFAADRVEHVKLIEEKLKESHVVCDRYLYSSIAYQTSQGVDEDFILQINRFAKKPDIVVLLTVDVEEGMKRLGKEKEIFEKEEFLKKVQNKYLKLAKKEGFIVIDTTNKSINESHEEILKIIKSKLWGLSNMSIGE
ncbi:dTMP kinase [Methanotorris igneus]|uniref:Probable thymidylate kinase n=1 Tax=Methanotorris igneus (strain DSM 5666 / JCM 11834 / Kol 5) TaxID=880724 RepID=F6BB90_METIK|nr:dTMP kinase [Methanotorris igneus]AEF95975.1 Thymidylate kinase [Methanotorris igneus Kol 5]